LRGCSYYSLSSVVILNIDFTWFCSVGWSFFHWKLCPFHFVFSMSILRAIEISLFSTNTKFQVNVDPPSTDIFVFSFYSTGEGISRNVFIWCVSSFKCSSTWLNSKSCTKFSLISSQFEVWPLASSILYHLLGKIWGYTLSYLYPIFHHSHWQS